jgi:hypothetical protein
VKFLLRGGVAVVFVAAGLFAGASSCSSSSNGGFGGNPGMDGGTTTVTDSGYVLVTIGDATYVQTGDALIQVMISDSGTVTVAAGSDATLPPPPGMDASLPPGVDATSTMPGSDATTAPGMDATSTPLPDGACPDSGSTAATCSATISGTALKLSSNYLTAAAAGVGMGGYAYTYSDSMGTTGGTSTACLDSTALCTSGTTDVSNGAATPNHYGAGVGFNLNQTQSTGCASMPVDTFTVPAGSVGVSYSLSNLPAGGVRLEIGNSATSASGTATGTDYCATLTAASGFIPWAQFNSQCWVNTAGDFLTGVPTAVTHINFGLPSGATTGSFNFCVDSVGFPTTVPDGGTGTTTSTNCNGSSCCEPSSGPAANGDGSLTCYTFKQGTPNNKTYCGYQGSETTYTGGGSGACQSQNNTGYTDTIPNVGPPSDYFAAFPGPGGPFGNGALCGMCVNVTYAGKTLMGTIADECPSSSNSLCGVGSNHLDLSAALARDLGIGVGTTAGNPTGVTWAAVACPIPTSQNNGNITVVWNASGQAYFQNVVWPVASVSGATQSNGYWSVNAGATVTLTDLIGHTITATMPGAGGGSLGKQFPSTCTN